MTSQSEGILNQRSDPCGSGLFLAPPSVHLLLETDRVSLQLVRIIQSIQGPSSLSLQTSHPEGLFPQKSIILSTEFQCCFSGSCVLITKPSRPLFCDCQPTEVWGIWIDRPLHSYTNQCPLNGFKTQPLIPGLSHIVLNFTDKKAATSIGSHTPNTGLKCCNIGN